MTKIIRIISMICLLVLLFVGCSIDNLESLKIENQELKKQIILLEKVQKENEILKTRIDSIKYSPLILLDEVINEFNDGEYNKALETIYLLIEKNPESEESKKALDIEKNIVSKISDIQKNYSKYDSKTLRQAAAALIKRKADTEDKLYYMSKVSPVRRDINSIYIYYEKTNSKLPMLRICLQYAGKKELDINKYIIKLDSKSYDIIPALYSVKSDKKGDFAWAWYDTCVDNYIYSVIKEIIESENISIICQGEYDTYERTVTATEKKAIKSILVSYENIGGILSIKDN